ncbi:MAG: arylamine N-acetyltransferase family protein [Acidimicrobiales bacterium]
MTAALRDLDAYLERLGLTGRPTLAQLHRAHIAAIPFENFDSYAGIPIELDPEHLEDKLVARGRGGYCFEHNLLFKGALEALGIDDITPMLARVRLGRDTKTGPRTHLVLRVVTEGQPWHVDVGFGLGGPLDPMPFGPGLECVQSGWRYRIVEDGPELVLQMWQEDTWADLYGFLPYRAEDTDITMSNWFTCTHPKSRFVSGVLAGARNADSCLSLFVTDTVTLVDRTLTGTHESSPSLDEVPALLASRFGLGGVRLGPGNRLVMEETS